MTHNQNTIKMSFDKYWNQLVSINHGLAKDDTRMTISVKSFRKSIRNSYLAGRLDAIEERKAADEFAQVRTNDMQAEDLFNIFFGGNHGN